MNTQSKLRAIAVICSALGLGCGKDESSPLPHAEASRDGGAGAPSPAREPRRWITRDPFGRTGIPGNLVVDGDFEITGRTGQQPWLLFGTGSQSALEYETGGLCASGVRCARIDPGIVIVGWFSSPKTEGMNVEFWAHPTGGRCEDLKALALDLDETSHTVEIGMLSTDGKTCKFGGAVPNFARRSPALYLSVVDGAPGPVLVDDVVITARIETRGLERIRELRSFPPSERARVAWIAKWIQDHRDLSGGPPHVADESPPTRAAKSPEPI